MQIQKHIIEVKRESERMKERPKEIMTITLIGINILVFIVLTMIGRTEDGYFMLQHGAMYEPYIIENQEYYRLFTSLFLHFGISHLLNNMVLLWALGSIFEKEAGKIRFLLCYFISGIGGNLLSLYWNTIHDRQIVSAGASGAIFGLMGGLLWIVFANRGRLGTLSGRGMLIMVVLSLYFGFTSTGVDNLAHVSGLICGFLTALLTYRRKNQKILTVSDINDI